MVSLKRVILRRKYCVAVLILLCCLLTIVMYNDDIAPDLYFLHWGPLENTSCHYSYDKDVLASAEEDFKPQPRSIFFHETSCRGGLNARQACSVESTARNNPDYDVYVMFSSPVESLSNSILKKLKELPNVHLVRVHLPKYVENTPAESMVKGGGLNRTRWRVVHTSDVLRFVTLFKFPGIYLDTDVVIVRNLGSLGKNWVAKESTDIVAAGAFAYSDDEIGRKIADICVRDVVEKFRGDTWSRSGPWVIVRAMQKVCSTTTVSKMQASSCKGIEVYSPEYFYPISYEQWDMYFQSGELMSPEPYGYHVWNHFSENRKSNKESMYYKIAKEHCPSVFEIAYQAF